MNGDTAGHDPEPISSTASAAPSHQATNWQIADYRMIRKIGEGGMGVVFEAEQQHPKRPVALKVIRGGRYVDEHHVKLFQREAQALGRLRHPCIATIYESGRTDDGQHFFAMELLRGETLSEYAVKRIQQPVSRTTLKELLLMFHKICDGVAYAHQRGVIHRDLKPANIIVQRESSRSDGDSASGVPDVKILDFGLARITDADLAQVSVDTDVGRIQGSVPYMSPEQVRGNPDEIDARTDVYSLGVILYELLTRRLPYELTNRSLNEAARIICEQPPAELGTSTDGSKRLDRDLRTIVFKALEKEPGRRYQSVSALQEDLARYLKNQPILAHPPSAAYQLRKLVSRHKVSFGSAVILVALLAIFAAAMTVQRNRAFAAEQRAAAEAQTASQVSDFLVKLFEVSNPSEARGRSFTAKEILDQGARRIEVELVNQPVVQARLMDTMGKVYNSLGLYQDAHQLLQSALDRRRRALGKEHLEVAASLNSLGELVGDEGDWKRAEALHREALEMRVRLLGNEHLDVAESMGNVAVAMTELGNYAAAEPLYRDVLQLKRKLLGDDDSRVAESLTDFGTFYVQKNDFKTAEPMLREALRINQKHFGHDHPEVSTNFSNLGMLLKDKGEFQEAESSMREALAIRRKLFGSEHIEVAQILNNLGTLYYIKFDVDSAQALFREALTIRKKVLGDEHPLTANTANNLAGTLIAKTDYKSAEVLFRDVLRVRQKVYGREHPSVAQSLNNLAAVKRRMGDYDDAETLLREALAINRKILGKDHSEIATELFNLGHVFAGRKDYRQAESWFRQSLEMRRRLHPNDHPDVAASLYQVANALFRLREYQAAEPLLLESFRINREKLGDSNLSTRTTAGLLVELYEAKGEREKAAQYRPVAAAASGRAQ